MEHMTVFLKPDTELPCYMVFPRGLLGLGINETAMLAYVVLLDRARLSMSRSEWVDEDDHVFLVYPIQELAATLQKSEMTVKSVLRVLESHGLIVRKRQGTGRPNRIYVKLLTDRELSAKQTEFYPHDGQEACPETERKPSAEQTEIYPRDRQNPVPVTDRKLSGNKNNRVITTEARTTQQERVRGAPAYGRYRNVILSQEELEDLRQSIPNYEDYIERLSAYMESSGKTYQNHAATIRSWAMRDSPKQQHRNYECKEDESL